MQDEEIPDELKRCLLDCPVLFWAQKQKTHTKITLIILNNFRIGVKNMVTKQYQLPIIMWEYIYHI